MKKRAMLKHSCMLPLAMMAWACGGSSSPVVPSAAATFSLTGQVADSTPPTLDAIFNATVTIVDGPNAGKSARTDYGGHFTLRDLQQSSFTINVSATSYVAQSQAVTLTGDQTVSFRLDRAASTVQPIAFELSGIATDGDGQPVANADLYLDFVAFDGAPRYAHASALTDGAGFYRIDISAIPGAMHGPVGTNDAVAFGRLSRSGYDDDYRYIVGTTHDIVRNFHLHRIRPITAGESTVVSISPDDSICSNNAQDFHPWPQEFVCRSVHIVAPSDGTMTVEALGIQGATRPGLEIEAAHACFCLANPESISVTAGTEVTASIEMAWGSTASQSFTLNTSMAPHR